MDELKGMNDNIDSPAIFESIKTTTNLDSDQLIKHFDDQVSESLNKSI